MKIKAQTLKGFRDFLPEEARKRQFVIDVLKKTFESYGFEPLETPTLEYAEILQGKYGDEGDLLMYKFEDRGGRQVAMRYDQTVPLARVVSQYKDSLPMPFKRYQIQNVFRAENTQKGRFREFLQCDIDTVGTSSPLADAEIVTCVAKALEALVGPKKYRILVNDSKIFQYFKSSEDVPSEKIILIKRTIDKLLKIKREGVLKELTEKVGLKQKQAEEILDNLEKSKPTDQLSTIINKCVNFGVNKDCIKFSPTLARGLDYYTGLILEIEIKGYDAGSVGGGGRYDNLIGMFAGKDIPAVGFAFGFDRLIEAMDELGLFPDNLQTTKVLIVENNQESLEIASQLRKAGINAEIWLDDNSDLGKKIKYAEKKQIPYVIKFDLDGKIILGNMKTGKQEVIVKDKLPDALS